MAKMIHERRYLTKGELVVVKCDNKCNVRLMDDTNFEQFRKGDRHEYYGGFYHILPAKIVVPTSGYWNVDIDAGWLKQDVKCDINYITATASSPSKQA